jgi:hypothetical protein
MSSKPLQFLEVAGIVYRVVKAPLNLPTKHVEMFRLNSSVVVIRSRI